MSRFSSLLNIALIKMLNLTSLAFKPTICCASDFSAPVPAQSTYPIIEMGFHERVLMLKDRVR